MKLSTKGRYGLRAMIDLAVHTESTSHQALAEIAERQDLSEIYLEQVFSALRRADIVKSIKGPQGGYYLTEDPERITVGAILRALEGELSIVDTSFKNDSDMMSIASFLKTQVWDVIDDSINTLVDTITLAELVSNFKSANANAQIMYFI